MKVSYRRIARKLVWDMPAFSPEEFASKVDDYTEAIEAMPKEAQATLKAAYIINSIAPKEDQEDLFQELVSHILTVLARYKTPIRDIDGFCYKVANRKYQTWLRDKRNRKRLLDGGFLSLDEPVKALNGEVVELHETVAGKLEWTDIRPFNLESEISSELDCQAVLDTMPDRVRDLVIKRLDYKKKVGHHISHSDSKMLWRYVQKNGDKIREALRAY